ncbi:MAG: TetR/AcrR family transcriptional regulator [Alphaproteobacteria bacterium]|nr:TetR/AcrR family transcriptional regulator [Alphaproteobacteria bacterium]MBU0798967.1 TetR/AcrR family transcriptional regulator [Alphaproteobacteria bacterium]MBU0887222.1 TetR/AcrR family transcriptional regulator [Alphaproteobacteria bacterium]MBU1812250.1 TetR/AcrR family transcriptional regulator [Alphaproteobacteria bacterium]
MARLDLDRKEPATGSKPAQILAAARAEFLRQGFAATSMDAIARAATVSKATVYAHFGNKEDLFAAMVASNCRRIAETLAEETLEGLPVREALTQIGRQFLAFLLSPDTQAIYRVVVAETPRFPDLGRRFYAAGPQNTRGRIAFYLERIASRGLIRIDDPARATEMFLGMVVGHRHLRRVLGLDAPAGEAEMAEAVGRAVDAFLKVYPPEA